MDPLIKAQISWSGNMWKSFKCRNGTGESGYMGFATIYENTLSYLLEQPGREEKDYFQLMESNYEIFTEQYAMIQKKVERVASDVATHTFTQKLDGEICTQIRLVEPRELLYLLNYIETHNTRLLYAPRPFYRSNVFCLTSLLQTKDNLHLACLFCGKCSNYRIDNDLICFTTTTETDAIGSELTLDHYNFSTAEIGGALFSNDLVPESQTVCRKPISENSERLHHRNCPIVWLHKDENAVWNYKDATFMVRGVSKFHHMLQFLTLYPRPREDTSWLCLINRMSACHVPGASKYTLACLFRIIAHERLKIVVDSTFDAKGDAKMAGVNRWVVYYSPLSHFTSPTGPPLHHYHELMHVNQYVSEVVNLADDTTDFEGHRALQIGELTPNRILPFGGSHAVLTPAREHYIVTRANEIKQYTTAHRPFDRTRGLGGKLSAEDVVGAFTDNTVTDLDYYRLLFLHGFLAQPLKTNNRPFIVDTDTLVNRTESHICLYCGVIFPNVLIHYKNAMEYFTSVQADRLIKYAIAGANEKLMHRVVYGRHLPPVNRFQATFPGDLTSNTLPRKVKSNERLRKALVWLSASMDALHSDECLFRLKRRSFVTNKCCVCFNERTEEEHVAMSCGHELCTSCYNEISITDCCMCKRGYRTRHMTVSDSVILGYLQTKVTRETVL